MNPDEEEKKDIDIIPTDIKELEKIYISTSINPTLKAYADSCGKDLLIYPNFESTSIMPSIPGMSKEEHDKFVEEIMQRAKEMIEATKTYKPTDVEKLRSKSEETIRKMLEENPEESHKVKWNNPWHLYEDESPKEVGYYLVTVEYNEEGKRDMELSTWNNADHKFEDVPNDLVVAWIQAPVKEPCILGRPYKKKVKKMVENDPFFLYDPDVEEIELPFE